MSTKFSGTSRQRLIDLINSDNNTSYILDNDIILGNFYPIDDGKLNTEMELIFPKRNNSKINIRYTRLPINVLYNYNSNIDLLVINQYPTSTYQLLNEINLALGLSLQKSEVVNLHYNEVTPTIPLTINTSSVAWLPSTYDVAIDMIQYPDVIHGEHGSGISTETNEVFTTEYSE